MVGATDLFLPDSRIEKIFYVTKIINAFFLPLGGPASWAGAHLPNINMIYKKEKKKERRKRKGKGKGRGLIIILKYTHTCIA